MPLLRKLVLTERRQPAQLSRYTAESTETLDDQGRTTQRDLVLEIEIEGELWRDPAYVAYATIKRDGHREIWKVRGKAYRRYLIRRTSPSARPGREWQGYP